MKGFQNGASYCSSPYIKPLVGYSLESRVTLLCSVPYLGRMLCQLNPLASAMALAHVVSGPEAVLFGVTHNGSS